jgi:transforming growth factor-beta-induced protein
MTIRICNWRCVSVTYSNRVNRPNNNLAHEHECLHVSVTSPHKIQTQKQITKVEISFRIPRFTTVTMMLRLATTFLICLGVTGASTKEGSSSALRQLQTDPTILAVIADTNTGLSTLDAAVTVAGLDQDLIDLDLTALAPTNAGFAALDTTFFTLLLTPAWNLHLKNILEYHLSNNPAFTFTMRNGSQLNMRNGEIVFVSVTPNPSGTGNAYTFSNSEKEGATLTQADIFADNGVAHIIDNVLKPSFFYRSVIDLLAPYSTLQNLALIAGLEGPLRDGTFTLLAPRNDAWNLLSAATISFLSSPAGNADLVEILQYHTMAGVFPSTILANGVGLPTAQGKSVSISIVGGIIMANDATVIDGDILALNGVTHGIDRVLMIPEDGQPTSAPVGTNTDPDPTIYTIVAETPDLSNVTTALVTSGLDAVLDDPTATLTALAPTDAAFDALPPGLFATLLTPAYSKHLDEVLQYHVSDEVFLSSDLFNGDVITMLNGETVTYSISNAGVSTFNQARIEMADIETSNGVAHIIGQVLLPSFASRTVIDLESDYSTLTNLIELADLEATLRGGAWTLFAPTNAAFEKLDQATLDNLKSIAGKDDLIELLTYHTIPQVLTAEKLSNGAMVMTAVGSRVGISVVDSQVKIDDSIVVFPDILAVNGVTHGIDTVLMPTSTETLPTSSPTRSAATSLFLTLSPTSGLGPSLLGLFVMALTAAW